MSAGAVQGPGRAGSPSAAAEARQGAQGFGRHLERARSEARSRARDRERAARAGAAASGAAGLEPQETRLRRRATADHKDAGLDGRRRELDGGERADRDRRAEVGPGGPVGPPPGNRVEPAAAAGPTAADLAAAVEKLAIAVERRERAFGPTLRMDLGGRLSVHLSRAERGIEIVFAGEPRLARLAQAELPAMVASLRERGIAVARAEVRARPEARGSAPEAGPARPGAR